MKKILAILGAIPVLALFGGIGILSYRISETWDAATTQALVTGLTVICGGGTLVLCILLALIVGVPLAIRAYGEGGMSRRHWNDDGDGWGKSTRPALPRFDDWQRVIPKRQPPMIDGYWQRLPDTPPSQPSPTPPWGATGGGHSQLLPPPQDDRFGVEG